MRIQIEVADDLMIVRNKRGEGLEGLNQACRDLGEMMNWYMGPKDRVMVVALID